MAEPTRILIVEDEVITAASIKAELEGLGYDVPPMVTRGTRAAQAAIVEQPDVVLMDINLPGSVNGIQAAQEILSQVDTRIIFMSGDVDAKTHAQIHALNPLTCLIKPIRVENLHKIIKTAL